jgi:peptide/nickel transport system substrate-binding protein
VFPGGAGTYRDHAENGANAQTDWGTDGYPYGYAQSRPDRARERLSEAGYGPENPYELTLTTYDAGAWRAVAEALAFDDEYLQIELQEVEFSTLLEEGPTGEYDAYALGWVMDWPAPDNFLGNVHPPRTDTDREGGARGQYLDWGGTPAAERAGSAWETVRDNRQPSTAARQARDPAYLAMEEAIWEDAILLPLYHRIDERFAYEWVEAPGFGSAGSSRQAFDRVVIDADHPDRPDDVE